MAMGIDYYSYPPHVSGPRYLMMEALIAFLTIWCPCHCFWSKKQELCRKLLFSWLDRAWLLEAETICVNSSHLRYVRHFCQMFTSFGPISERPLLDCCPDFLGYVFFLQLLQQWWRKLISKQRKGLSDNRGSGRKILIAVEISDVSSPKFQTERGEGRTSKWTFSWRCRDIWWSN